MKNTLVSIFHCVNVSLTPTEVKMLSKYDKAKNNSLDASKMEDKEFKVHTQGLLEKRLVDRDGSKFSLSLGGELVLEELKKQKVIS